MATGDTLATLIEEVQYECGHVASPSAGQNLREHIKSRIRREYRRLYHDYNWRHLRSWVDIQLNAGQRYYDYPTGVTQETLIELYTYDGGQYLPVTDDLQVTDYGAFNSDDDVRSDPVLRFRPYGAAQIEVWPVPAGDDGHLRAVVKRAFNPLVDEDDTCDLDTDLIVLHVAAEITRKQDDKEAAVILARAQQHYDTLKNRQKATMRKFSMVGGPSPHAVGFSDKIIVGIERS